MLGIYVVFNYFPMILMYFHRCSSCTSFHVHGFLNVVDRVDDPAALMEADDLWEQQHLHHRRLSTFLFEWHVETMGDVDGAGPSRLGLAALCVPAAAVQEAHQEGAEGERAAGRRVPDSTAPAAAARLFHHHRGHSWNF